MYNIYYNLIYNCVLITAYIKKDSLKDDLLRLREMGISKHTLLILNHFQK